MMRVTKAMIATAKEFDDAATEIAREEYGAITSTRAKGALEPILKMDTTYGPMFVWPSTSPSKNPLFTVFCRFETDDKNTLQRAWREIGSNQFSGKYNFHDDRSLDEAVRSFRMHLQRAVVE